MLLNTNLDYILSLTNYIPRELMASVKLPNVNKTINPSHISVSRCRNFQTIVPQV